MTDDNAHLTTEQVIREMHGDLKVVIRVQDEQLIQATETNGRLSSLERWRDRIIGGGTLAVVFSPLLIFEVREWFSRMLGGG